MKYIRTKDGVYRTDYHNDEQGYYITTDYQDLKTLQDCLYSFKTVI